MMQAVVNTRDTNKRLLDTALDALRARLQQYIAAHTTADAELSEQPQALNLPALPYLVQIAERFKLSHFEQHLLLLCAAVELDGEIATLCGAAQHNERQLQPTFSLALALLPGAHWSALLPTAPLRRWQLIEPGPGTAMVYRPLTIAEPVLHALLGLESSAEWIRRLLIPVECNVTLPPFYARLVERSTDAWNNTGDLSLQPVLRLSGGDLATCRVLAYAIATACSYRLYYLDASLLSEDINILSTWITACERECRLHPAAVLLDCTTLAADDARQWAHVRLFIERFHGSLALYGLPSTLHVQRTRVQLDITALPADEQRLLWAAALGSRTDCLNGQIDQVVSQFRLGPAAIATASALSSAASDEMLASQLWEACRTVARPELEAVAQRMSSRASWSNLVLPAAQLDTLHTIVTQVRQRAVVYEQWGFGAESSRGLGISVLFAGASGTGKTLAAEVVAHELRLDLYRIDLSQVVSKYIGETEKNLRRIFDAAESGGAVLLFDEADALFGKRSDVKDSHDRYANIEVSYLLQRMESYRGLAILTSNQKSALDNAFLRRLRFIVQFPFPDAAQREIIWRRVFPPAVPLASLDYAKLARLNVAGGSIRNIALGAAFLAAEAGAPLGMDHLLMAARSEYAKLERALPEAEMAEYPQTKEGLNV